MERKLPKGWLEKPFTEILDIQGGTQPPKEVFISEERVGYIRLLQIRDFGEKPVPTYIPNEANLKTCSTEDILIARYGASIGRIVTGHAGAYNVALAKVIIPELINRRFIFWLLKSPLFQINITSFQRTAQNGFNKEDLSGLEIPLPPLPEQQRIVAKLDTLFGQIDRIKTSMERIPQLLKDFRQKILTQAVTGKSDEFVELADYDINIQTGPFGSALHKEDYVENGIPVINPSHIIEGEIIPSHQVTITEGKLNELSRWILEDGDVILGRRGEMGRAAAYFEPNQKMICGTGSVVLKKSSKLDSLFLMNYLRSAFVISFLETNSVGSTMVNLNQKIIKSIPFPDIDIEEQRRRIMKIESLFAKADSIEARYQKLKEKIEQLPQALLAKAFRGELVEQLPTDGDARDLLEQIKQAKAGLEKPGKSKKLKVKDEVRMAAEEEVKYGREKI